MRRRIAPYLLTAAAFILAACSDATAPTPSPSELATAQNIGVAAARTKNDVGVQTISFALHPQGGHVAIGNFSLDYPAGVVCDPTSSGYGPDEWKKACKTLKSDFIITAKYWVVDGQSYIDFAPNIRFDPSKEVILSARVRELRNQWLTDELRAKYSLVSLYGDDTEATIFATKRNGMATGVISHRIYHFSGYYVRTGQQCEEGDLTCGME